MKKTAAKKIKINKGIIIQKIGDKTTIFDENKSVLFTLNSTATFIFEKIKSGEKPEEIIEKLAIKYGEDPKRVKKDYLDFICKLKDKGIVYKIKPSR